MNDWLPDEEIVGDIAHRETATQVEVSRRDHGEYHILSDGRSTHADVLNLATSAAALSRGSSLELGGDRLKRVTHTDVGEKTYVYVEVGDRRE